MIELNNLNLNFKDKNIFKNASLEITNNGIYLLKGSNGVGKTTLLNIIARKSKRVVGYAFQDSYLIEYLTIKEHLDLYEIDESLLDMINLKEKINKYPKELSEGEKARIATLLSLCSGNEIVLLDEPFANLDKENITLICELISLYKESKTIIITNHGRFPLNNELVGIIEIENNKIITKRKKGYVKDKKELKKNKLSKCYSRKNFRHYLKDRIKIYLIYLLGLIFIFLGLFLEIVLNNIVKNDISNSIIYNKSYINECDSECLYNYDYLLNYFYNHNDLYVASNSEVALKEGKYPSSISEAIGDDSHYLGEVLMLDSNTLINDDNIDIYNDHLEVTIVGILNDLKFNEQEGIYFDYDSVDKYYEGYVLINNDLTIKEYYKELDLDNYKFLGFSYNESEYAIYYDEVKEIVNKIDKLMEGLVSFMCLLLLYHFYRYLKNYYYFKKKEIRYLKYNSFSKFSIFKSICKYDLLVLSLFTIIFLILSIITKENLIYLCSYFLLAMSIYFGKGIKSICLS